MSLPSSIPLTCSRSGTATRVNAQGYVESVSANAIREDYHPTLKTRRGLLVERNSENIVLSSEDFSNTGIWGSVTGGTLTADAITGPDGLVSGDQYIEDSGSTARIRTQTITKSSSSVAFVASVFIKNVSGSRRVAFYVGTSASITTNRVKGTFTASTGAVATAAGSGGTWTAHGSGSVDYGNGWYRIWISGVTSTDTSIAISLRLADTSDTETYTGNGSSGVAFWGAMIELGSSTSRIDLTSYIPTTIASVTRGTEDVYLSLSGICLDASELTLYSEIQVPFVNQIAERIGVQLNDATDSTPDNAVYGCYGGNGGATVLNDKVDSGGAAAYNLDAAPVSLAALTTLKHIVRVKANDFRGCWNGTLNGNDTSGNMPVDLVRLNIGSGYGGSSPINGWIRKVMIWPVGLSDGNLQTQST